MSFTFGFNSDDIEDEGNHTGISLANDSKSNSDSKQADVTLQPPQLHFLDELVRHFPANF